MGIIVLFTSFALTLFIIFTKIKIFRHSWVLSALIYGVIIFTSTESLSNFKQLNYWSILYLWTGVLVTNIAFVLYLYKSKNLARRNLYFISILKFVKGLRSPIFLVVVIAVLINLLTALIAPPNNWDSMTYHMPRVMHWIQNQSVEHYPTHIIRQISFPPGASYLVMHFQILAGGDQFANLVQCIAYIGCILVSSSIVEIILGKQYRLIGALFTASIPMAIMQSTTTQNDLVVSYWLTCLLYFTLARNPYTLPSIISIGLSFGLAIITKYTAYIFGAPIIGIWIIRYTLKQGTSKTTKVINLVLLVAIIITPSIPHFLRNYALFGSVLGDDMGTSNESINLITMLSNLLRLLTINIPIPGIWAVVSWLHTNILQIDINNPETTFSDTAKLFEFFRPIIYLAPSEDHVANPLHLFGTLIGITGVFIGHSRSKSKNYIELMLLSIAVLAGILMFCLLLKFQVWHNRLLLPLLILSTPLFVQQLISIRRRLIYSGVLAILMLSAIAYALTPLRHPILGLPITTQSNSPSILSLSRKEIYFSGERKELREPYFKAVELISKSECRKIGLVIGGDDWEYPLWALLKDKGLFRIRHISVDNASHKLEDSNRVEEVCAIISTIPTYQNSNPILSANSISHYPYVAVYLAGGL